MFIASLWHSGAAQHPQYYRRRCVPVTRHSGAMDNPSMETRMPAATAVLDEIQEMFDRIDEDGDGSISFAEFTSLMLELDHQRTGAALRESFAAIDSDGDGRVSLGEFSAWVSR
jgi:Ca2+-binding EF-hand superfamily protein